MLKKIILICSALFVLMGASVQAFNDIYDTQTATAVSQLVEYDIISGYDDNTFKPENNITRAEFAKIIIATTHSYMSVDDNNGFNDTKNHWAESYIDIAQYLGIINGRTDNEFAPNDNVTYEEAIKMIVVALGYDIEAVQLGGYPYGYIQEANNLGITSNVQYSPKLPATRGNVALLIKNALDVQYYALWNNNGIIEREKTNKTLYQLHEDILEADTYVLTDTSGVG